MKHIKFIASMFLCWLAFVFPALAEGSTATIWSKIVVIGASVSDGYDRSEPIGGVKSEELSLEHYLESHIIAEHGKITNFGNKFFFISPQNVSLKQVENAEKLKPSAVLAPDFLFWLVYGNMKNEDSRITSLDRGLKLLEKFECPMVLGNIPNASKAIYKMLSPSQVPKLETMTLANERIAEWVKKRKNVIVLNNELFMKNSHANKAIELKNINIPKGETIELLQKDLLHPTIRGARAITLALLESLQDHSNFPKSDVNWKLSE